MGFLCRTGCFPVSDHQFDRVETYPRSAPAEQCTQEEIRPHVFVTEGEMRNGNPGDQCSQFVKEETQSPSSEQSVILDLSTARVTPSRTAPSLPPRAEAGSAHSIILIESSPECDQKASVKDHFERRGATDGTSGTDGTTPPKKAAHVVQVVSATGSPLDLSPYVSMEAYAKTSPSQCLAEVTSNIVQQPALMEKIRGAQKHTGSKRKPKKSTGTATWTAKAEVNEEPAVIRAPVPFRVSPAAFYPHQLKQEFAAVPLANSQIPNGNLSYATPAKIEITPGRHRKGAQGSGRGGSSTQSRKRPERMRMILPRQNSIVLSCQ